MFEREVTPVGTMTAQIARSLGTRIVSGEFLPGASLPVEADLCQIYGVSRTVIREAIKNLAAKRLIEVSPKVGTRVLSFSDWNLLDRDVLAWRLAAQFDAEIVGDIFEMRICFEPRAAFRAARDGTDDDHRQIRRHFEDLAAAYQETIAAKLAAEAALEFHLAVINASHNGMFVTIGSAIKSVLRASSEMLQRNAARPVEDVRLHEAVCRSILDRRPEDAARDMDCLLRESRAWLLPFTIGHGRAGSVAGGR